MLQNFYSVLVFLVLGAGFAAAALIAAWVFRPQKATPEKLVPYECGVDTEGPTWVQFKISYFLYALVFLVFDVETIFLYPLAVVFKKIGTPSVIAAIIFILILIIGFWYEWKEGALEWT